MSWFVTQQDEVATFYDHLILLQCVDTRDFVLVYQTNQSKHRNNSFLNKNFACASCRLLRRAAKSRGA